MSVNLSLLGGAGWQFFTDNGTPLAGGLLYTYLAGTSTAATTYTTSAGNVPNSNPIVLNSAGRVQTEIWLTQGVSYKFVLKTSAFITIGTYDNIDGAADPADIYAALAASSGSSLVGFIQSGSGAVATTVQTKLRESVSVLDFGAVSGGVTATNTAAFQAALATGKDVFVPEGTYDINATLVVGNQRLFGIGIGHSKITTSAALTSMLHFPSTATVSGATVELLELIGNNVALYGILYEPSTSSRNKFADLYVSGFTQTAIYIKNSIYCWMERVSTLGGIYGLYCDNSASSTFYSCIFANATGAPIFVGNASSSNTFYKCVAYNDPTYPAPAILIIDYAFSNSFVDCEFEPQGAGNVTSTVILRDSNGVGPFYCTDNSFSRCRFVGLANTKTNDIQIGDIGTVYKTRVTECGFINPTSTSSIDLIEQRDTGLTRNYGSTSYASQGYSEVSITNTGGYSYYIENLTSTFGSVSITGGAPGLITWSSGTGSPEGVVVAVIGSLYSRIDGGAGTTLYVKESGTNNVGWVAK